MSVYQSRDLIFWLEPLLSDLDWETGLALVKEAREHSAHVPTGDQWT